MMFAHVQRNFYFLAFALLISACGGGGGNNAAAPPPPPTPPPTFSIGGAISGLVDSIVLQNNGGDDLSVSADGNFEFSAALVDGRTYNITVLTQPAGQLCVISDGSGTIDGTNVTGVSILCGPASPSVSISGVQVKLLRFDWADVVSEAEYRLMEDITGTGNYILRGILSANATNAVIEIFVPDYVNARYKVQACDANGCIDSNEVFAVAALEDAIGYAKALAPDADDWFGGWFSIGRPIGSVALSDDGDTLAVGVPKDASDAIGIDGDPNNNNAATSGAVFVFSRLGPANWVQQAYIKASNAETADAFGLSVALSGDGNVMVVGAPDEDGGATGINGDESDNSVTAGGAAYAFLRDVSGGWGQTAYLKPAVIDSFDSFGSYLTLAEDGSTLLISSAREDSSATGVNANANDNAASESGAVYVFSRDGSGDWAQQAYIKASNAEAGDRFGWRMALSAAGDRAVISAYFEDSAATGANGNQADNSRIDSGAVYIFDRDTGDSWSQTAYVKATNTDTNDQFGASLDISSDGNLLVVGAPMESSATSGIGGNQMDNSAGSSGAVYVLVDDGFGTWSQQAYIKPANTSAGDLFGNSVSFGSLENMLAVGAPQEDSFANGIDGDQFDDTATDSGAAYLFDYDGTSVWSQRNYLKAPNNDAGDLFGSEVVISADGLTLVVVAPLEDAASTSGGDANDNSAGDAGAAFIY